MHEEGHGVSQQRWLQGKRKEQKERMTEYMEREAAGCEWREGINDRKKGKRKRKQHEAAPMASISSMKMMQGDFRLAESKRSLTCSLHSLLHPDPPIPTRRAPTPTYISSNSEPATLSSHVPPPALVPTGRVEEWNSRLSRDGLA
eukprot:301849-Hanusia_phi.AAC.5